MGADGDIDVRGAKGDLAPAAGMRYAGGTMSHTNRVDAGFAEGGLEALLAALAAVEALIPQAVNLDAAKRRSLPKMGARTEAFVAKALEAGENNPQFVPQYVDLVRMRADVGYAAALRQVESRLGSILEKVSDTRLLAGSEAFSAARMLYRSFAGAEGSGVPGAGALKEALAPRFSGQKEGGRKSGARRPDSGDV